MAYALLVAQSLANKRRGAFFLGGKDRRQEGGTARKGRAAKEENDDKKRRKQRGRLFAVGWLVLKSLACVFFGFKCARWSYVVVVVVGVFFFRWCVSSADLCVCVCVVSGPASRPLRHKQRHTKKQS
jgi:hypothetical protein